MPDQTTILRQLIADSPDATDAQVAALYPDAAKLPRPGPVTITTLGDILGTAAIAISAALDAAKASPDATVAAKARYADKVLATGFDPNNPLAVALMAEFVPGVLTQPQADAVRWVIPAAPAESDVATVRVAMARDAAMGALKTAAGATAALVNDRNGKIAWLDAHPDAAAPADLSGLDAFTVPTDPA